MRFCRGLCVYACFVQENKEAPAQMIIHYNYYYNYSSVHYNHGLDLDADPYLDTLNSFRLTTNMSSKIKHQVTSSSYLLYCDSRVELLRNPTRDHTSNRIWHDF